MDSAHHLVSGSYTNTSLFLLAFDTVARTLSLKSTVPAFGLHQFVTTKAAKDHVYATAMSEPPQLFSWAVDENHEFTHINTVNISMSGDSKLGQPYRATQVVNKFDSFLIFLFLG